MISFRKLAASATVIAGVVIVVTEVLQWRASFGESVPVKARAAVIVLGLPGNNPLLRSAQRWRVSQAIRACAETDCGIVVFTGGSPHSESAEAQQMAYIASKEGLQKDLIVLETASSSTRENIINAYPLVADAEAIVIVSDPMHAARARRRWRELQPLDTRPVVVFRRRPLDRLWIAVPSTFLELLRAL